MAAKPHHKPANADSNASSESCVPLATPTNSSPSRLRPSLNDFQRSGPELGLIAVVAQLFDGQRGLQIELPQKLFDVLGQDVALQIHSIAGAVAG